MSANPSTCGCCAAPAGLETINNRPGLRALQYRIGVYGSFLAQMLEDIHSVQLPSGPNQGSTPLTALTKRSLDDPSIALLDAWSVVADVLTFYQERIANEGYLRTATERLSILQMAREIGYELAPGVASNVLLQFTVDNIVAPPPPGSPAPANSPLNSGMVTIPAGSQVQSIPAAGQQAQLFETTADFTAYVDRNSLQPMLARRPDLALCKGKLYLVAASASFLKNTDVHLPASQVYLLNPATTLNPSLTEIAAVEMNQLYLQGISTMVNQGDRILLAGFRGTSVATETFTVNNVTTNSAANTTCVSFGSQPLPLPTFASASLPAVTLGNKLLALNDANVAANILNAKISEGDLQAFIQNNNWDPAQLQAMVDNPPARTNGTSGAFAFRSKCGFYGNNAPLYDSLPVKTSQRGDTYTKSWDDANGGRGTFVWTDSQRSANNDADVFLERTFPQILPDSWAYFESPDTGNASYRVAAVTEKTLADYGMSGRATGLKLEISAQTRGVALGSPAVIEAFANQVDVFAIGVDGHLYHRWRDSSGTWIGPVDLGGDGLRNSPSAVSWGANRIDVFAIDSKGDLFHWYTDGNNQFNGPENRGGGKMAGSPCAVSRAVNSLDIVAVGSDGNLYHTNWENSAWAGPDSLGGGGILKNNPSAVTLGPAGIVVYALALDGDLYQTIWLAGGITFGPAAMALGFGMGILNDSPSAIPFGGWIFVAIRDIGGQFFIYTDNPGFGAFAGFWALAAVVNGVFTGSPVLVTDGILIQIFGMGTNGNLYNVAWGAPWFPCQQLSTTSLGGENNLLGVAAGFSRGLGNFDIVTVGSSGHIFFTSFGASGFPTLKDLGNGSMPSFRTRSTTAYVQSAQLQLAGIPVIDAIPQGARGIMLGEMTLGLEIGQPIMLTGTRADAQAVASVELLYIASIEHIGGFTTLNFTEPLRYSYRRSTVTMSANLTAATNGGTTQEVFGSGDSSQSGLSLTLKKSPLTFVSAPTGTGVQSTLKVSVNNVRWQEALTLYGMTASDQDYTVRLADDGTVTVGFGDPAQRPRTGQQNITATYRTQIGAAGNVAAGSITTLMSRPAGLRGVVNPLPATGGADPQQLADARINAPITVLTLERIVSVEDYENFARAFAGVGKAQAIAVWSGETHLVYLTVAASDGTSVTKTSGLYTTLVSAITKLKDPVQLFEVAGFQSLAFSLSAALLIETVNFQTASVQATVVAALTAAFSFATRDFAQSVTEAEIVSLIQNVPGILACNLSKLYLTGDPSGPLQTEPPPFLAASPARWQSGAIQPAQLLILNTSGITLTEMKP